MNKKKDKTRKALELIQEHKEKKKKGSVTVHFDKEGVIRNVEHKEFF